MFIFSSALTFLAEVIVQNQPALPIEPANQNPSNNQPLALPDEPPPIPQGKSLGHHRMMANKVKVCSFDLETAGENAGVVQISSKLSTSNFVNGACVGFTHMHQTFDFDRYVQPPEGLYWNTGACD
jgi:hypothetical protein